MNDILRRLGLSGKDGAQNPPRNPREFCHNRRCLAGHFEKAAISPTQHEVEEIVRDLGETV